MATLTGRPVQAPILDGVSPDSLTAVFALLVLIWNDELGRADGICDTVLADARRRGSMSMVAHASCLRSMIMRRLGRLEEAADDARVALEFKLATSPPLAVAWAAAFGVDALTCLGRLDEADAMAAAAAGRKPPDGWIHTALFRQVRGALRVAQHRPGEALEDLLAVAAHRALGQTGEAAALAEDQVTLARQGNNAITLGVALRAVQPPDRRAPVRHSGHRGNPPAARLP